MCNYRNCCSYLSPVGYFSGLILCIFYLPYLANLHLVYKLVANLGVIKEYEKIDIESFKNRSHKKMIEIVECTAMTYIASGSYFIIDETVIGGASVFLKLLISIYVMDVMMIKDKSLSYSTVFTDLFLTFANEQKETCILKSMQDAMYYLEYKIYPNVRFKIINKAFGYININSKNINEKALEIKNIDLGKPISISQPHPNHYENKDSAESGKNTSYPKPEPDLEQETDKVDIGEIDISDIVSDLKLSMSMSKTSVDSGSDTDKNENKDKNEEYDGNPDKVGTEIIDEIATELRADINLD